MSLTITDLRQAQPNYFSRGNKSFFGDVSYKVLHGKTSKKPYMIRSTYMWSDMFGSERRLCWRINEIDTENGKPKVGKLIDEIFYDMRFVKDWLEDN